MYRAFFPACVCLVGVAVAQCRCVEGHALEQATHDEAILAFLVGRCGHSLLLLLTLLLLLSFDEDLIHVLHQLVLDQYRFLEGLDVEEVLVTEVVLLCVCLEAV